MGSFTLAVSTASDVRDLSAKAQAGSVTGAPVLIGTAYHAWAATHGLADGGNAGVVDDPDGDGCPNFEEFAHDTDPLSGSDSGKKRTAIESSAGADYFTYTFPVRNSAIFTGATVLSATVDGLAYEVSSSHDLLTFGQSLVEITPAIHAGLPPLSDGWNYRTFRMSLSVAELFSGFIRLATAPASA